MRRNGLRLAITLLTVIPVRSVFQGAPPSGPPDHSSLTRPGGPEGLHSQVTAKLADARRGPQPVDRAAAGAAMAWAPGVGLLLGAAAAGVLVVADRPLGAGALAGAVLAVAVLALLSRGLHLDGLADLADGLGSGKPADAALDIMRKSDIGPLGVVTLVFAVLIQVTALAHAESAGGMARGAAAVVAALVTSRLAMTWGCRAGVPAARPGGLGALVAGSVRPAVALAETLLVIAAAIGTVLGWNQVGWTLPLAVLAGLGTAFALERHAVRRLGGVTGDVLGGLGEVATTVALLVATMGPRA